MQTGPSASRVPPWRHDPDSTHIERPREAVGEEFDNPLSWATTIQFYAMMYGAPVVMTNRVGREG